LDNYRSLVDLIIKDEMEGKPSHERVLLIGATPQYLIDHAGFPDLEMAIKANVICKACFDHGLSTSLLKRLPDIIAFPKCLFRPEDSRHVDSVVVLTLEVKGLHPIIVPLRMNQQVGRGNIYNLVSSVYGKEGPDPEVKWKSRGLLIHEL
jgi:hypothetical protein